MQYKFIYNLTGTGVSDVIEELCNANDSYDVVKIESYTLPVYGLDTLYFWILLAKPEFNDPYADTARHFTSTSTSPDEPPF